MYPFAGIFETYLLPNNHPDLKVRLIQLENAIKLVYASIYSPDSRNYFEAINYKVEEEKMGVILQELVGNEFEGYYYPHISGTAQSFNYYPVSHMKPEDGVAVMAVGLGSYVVAGEKAYRFCPKYPEIEINSPKNLYKDSQVQFVAVEMNQPEIDLFHNGENAALARLDISVSEKHGNLKHCASVYDNANSRIEPGITMPGPRIINFANILKYDYLPLAKTIELILEIVEEAFGTPVEIEYAVDLLKAPNKKPSFYVLQIKPLLGNNREFNIDLEKFPQEKIILHSEKSMGNGVLTNIYDVVYIDTKKFNNLETLKMVQEIEKINASMQKEHKQYILVGPGRWGSSDRFIGIPVTWSQISNAKIIVEISTEEFSLDASLGSHFFHNVTSMEVGYFSIQNSSTVEFIDWNIISNQHLVQETNYFRHVCFEKSLTVIMDGRKRLSLIMYDFELPTSLDDNDDASYGSLYD
jgi:hypothetical protein